METGDLCHLVNFPRGQREARATVLGGQLSTWANSPQQIEGIEAMLDDQEDREKVKNSTLDFSRAMPTT